MDGVIDIEQFSAVHLLVGRIVSVAAVEGSNKMLNLSVDVGETNPRTILSGIGRHYSPDDLVGVSCIVVANLRSREILGTESNGMLVCASYTGESGDEVVRVVEPPHDVPIGSRLT